MGSLANSPLPAGLKRTGEKLTVFHPTRSTFVCTEPGCEAKFHASSWTAMRRSVERHLLSTHKITISSTENVCKHCDKNLGIRPTSGHACSQTRPTTPISSPVQYPHACTQCNNSFPNKRGLSNHLQWHKLETQKQQRSNTISLPQANTRQQRKTTHTTTPARSAARRSIPISAVPDTGTATTPSVSRDGSININHSPELHQNSHLPSPNTMPHSPLQHRPLSPP
mgnify:CR=1 FL=1